MKPTLGILLNLGDSFKTYRQSGRDIHWRNNYLKYYPHEFNQPLVFSYYHEPNPFPELIKLLPNRTSLPRFIYTFLIPFIYFKQLKSCQVLRVKQMPGVWPALIAKLFWRLPVISTYGYDYCLFAKKEGHRFSLPFINLTEFFGLKFSDKIIVTNSAMKQKISRLVESNKIVLLPNGVDTQLFKPKVKPATKNLHLVSIGRLVYQKNFSSLITAVSRLKTDRPISLNIVGNGYLESELVALAKKLSVKLTITQFLPHDQIADFLQSGDIFVMPSHYEGSPKALLEAMSCGLPCIVANKPYSRFIISNNKNGIFIQDLTKDLEKLINNSLLAQQIGRQARLTIIKHFNNQDIIHREIKLLLSLIK